MKKILVTGCGGAPTLNFVRSLRDTDPKREKYTIIGVDAGVYTIQRSECDRQYLCPNASDERYIPFLLNIIKKEHIEFIHTQPEIEVYTVGKNRKQFEQAGCRLFMPDQKSIDILRDKYASYISWKKAGIKVPQNRMIETSDDLKKAFKQFGNAIWIRETIGAAGKGSLSMPTYDLAREWIEYRKGWGHTVAAEYLSPQSSTWQSIWHNGKLVVGQGRKRLYWEMANRAQSGVTGVTGTGMTVHDQKMVDLAIRCIRTVDDKPNGIFSVDFTYDKNGDLNPTEINIGKFFTTHHFITRAGCNMPEILVQLAFDEYKGAYMQIDPCPPGLCWIRGMDKEPVLVPYAEIESMKKRYHDSLEE